jgi:GNAT superfamily N-acetyltransferase
MLEIKRAGVKDHGVVVMLLVEFSSSQNWEPEVDRDGWDHVVAELLGSPRWLFLVAYENDEPVGLTVLNFMLSLQGAREEARIAALIVEREHRRKSVGGELLKAAIVYACRRGCREIETTVVSDEGTAAFLRKFDHDRENLSITWKCRE